MVFLGGLATEHLNGACEQSGTSCLMPTKTCCIPGAGMAHRGGEHGSQRW